MSVCENDQAIPTAMLGDFTYFSQTDPRWGDLSYTVANDPEQTIGRSGCVPTLQAMVLANLCVSPVTPPELAAWNIDNGMRTETQGTRRASWNLLADQMGLAIEVVPPSAESLAKALQIGGLVVVSLSGAGGNRVATPAGHAIGLREASQSTLVLADPNSRANSEREWPYEDILPFAGSSLKHIYRRESDEASGVLHLATEAERKTAEKLAYAQDRAGNL